MIDTHAHIDFDIFRDDFDELIERAKSSGIEYIIIPGVEFKDFERILELTRKYEMIYCALGVHPHHANDVDEKTFEIIEDLAKDKKVVAIGETGIDYYYDFAPKDVQQVVFRKHLQLAKKLNLPAIVHNREADDDILKIIEQEQDGSLRGVLHCFSSSAEVMEKAMELNFNVSFTGNITFKKTNLADVVISTPLKRMMIETDSPFMTPVPNRGKRNEPAFVKFIAEKISEYKSISTDEVISMTTKNAKQLFKLIMFALIFTINTAFSQGQPVPKDTSAEELINPYSKFIGISPFLGMNTIVRTFHLKGTDADLTFEGLLAGGGSVYYGITDFCLLEVGYLYCKNQKIADLNVNISPTIYNLVEISSHWIVNPYSRVNVYGTLGLTLFFNKVNNNSSIHQGLGTGLGFLVNLPTPFGLFNFNAEWRLNFVFGNEYENYIVRGSQPIWSPSSAFYSIPRLGVIYYPKLKKD